MTVRTYIEMIKSNVATIALLVSFCSAIFVMHVTSVDGLYGFESEPPHSTLHRMHHIDYNSVLIVNESVDFKILNGIFEYRYFFEFITSSRKFCFFGINA